MKPKLFIGSSTEALNIAYAIQENLQDDVMSTVWTQGIFELSRSALDNLLKAVKDFDFAVFVFQPDDMLQIRTGCVPAARDNVVFELGLFIGTLGKEKVFYLVPKMSEKIHLPTDLLGVEPGSYDPPERDEDLLSALGPFCNRVRRQIKNLRPTEEGNVRPESGDVPSEAAHGLSDKAEETRASETEELDYGIDVDAFGNYGISIAPTVFFADRIAGTFPGIRGLHWYTEKRECVDRLLLLLKEPIAFENAVGHGVFGDPIWWWRGGQCLPIRSFQSLGDHCLMDVHELEIRRIAVYWSDSYYRHLVYVETSPQQPTGLYPADEATIRERLETFGYASEEYALFQDVAITRECYDDGAAVIDGDVVDTRGVAKLRIRYLSTYNFLIASKGSPINTGDFDMVSKPLLDGMLRGRDHLEELCDLVERLPRHRLDY